MKILHVDGETHLHDSCKILWKYPCKRHFHAKNTKLLTRIDGFVFERFLTKWHSSYDRQRMTMITKVTFGLWHCYEKKRRGGSSLKETLENEHKHRSCCITENIGESEQNDLTGGGEGNSDHSSLCRSDTVTRLTTHSNGEMARKSHQMPPRLALIRECTLKTIIDPFLYVIHTKLTHLEFFFLVVSTAEEGVHSESKSKRGIWGDCRGDWRGCWCKEGGEDWYGDWG